MSKAPPPSAQTPDQLDREAAQWFARMRGPDAAATRDAFEAWLAQGAAHRAAYNRAGEIFAMGKLLAEQAPISAPRYVGGRVLALAAIALSLVAMASWMLKRPAAPLDQPSKSASETETIATRPSETRTVRLVDGSTLTLGGASSVALRFDPAGRRLRLLQGRAQFDVAHEPRSFTVLAGRGSITARGTVFEVVLTPEHRVEVHLVEGAVDVALPRRPREAAVVRRLQNGERISFEAGTAATPPSAAVPAPAATVAHDYQGITVAALITQANRGARRPIRITDPVLGASRLSGRFRIDDTALLARRIATVLSGKAIMSDQEILLTR